MDINYHNQNILHLHHSIHFKQLPYKVNKIFTFYRMKAIKNGNDIILNLNAFESFSYDEYRFGIKGLINIDKDIVSQLNQLTVIVDIEIQKIYNMKTAQIGKSKWTKYDIV